MILAAGDWLPCCSGEIDLIDAQDPETVGGNRTGDATRGLRDIAFSLDSLAGAYIGIMSFTPRFSGDSDETDNRIP